MSDPGRTVSCPSCATGYFLPAELIGPRGARVRCPKCRTAFVVEAPQAEETGASHEQEVAGQAQHAERTTPRDPEKAAPLEQEPARAPEPAGPPAGPDSRNAGPPDPSGDAPPESEAARLANAALAALEALSGGAMARAAAQGTLFTEHGAELMAAFDGWRREAGRDADAAVFRAALKARWGIDLT